MTDRLAGHLPVSRRAPPYAFALLHVCTAWPVGIVSLAIGNRLTALGVPVYQTAGMIATVPLAFSLEFLWAPLVDATFTRRRWYVSGALVMCVSLAMLLMAPWTSKAIPLLEVLAFTSCSGAALADVAIKGLMAYEIPAPQLGAASGFYTAWGYFAKAIGAVGTLWLLEHLASRPVVGIFSAAAAAVAGTSILLASPSKTAHLHAPLKAVRTTLTDVWGFLRTRRGAVIAILCVIPFGSGTEAGLVGAIANEWDVSTHQLGEWIAFSAVGTIAGAIFSGGLSTRIGAWRTYLLLGSAMVIVVATLAIAPRVPAAFLTIEFLYRGLTGGCYAATLGLVMTAIGKGAASTKAAVMWSLFNFAAVLPTIVEGVVHDRVGTTAMLLTDAALGLAGLGALLLAMRLLAFRFTNPETAAVSGGRNDSQI